MVTDIKNMLLQRILATRPDVASAAYINFSTGERYQNWELDFSLIKNPNNISEVDSEDATFNSEGNLDGVIGIYLNNDDWVIFEGENLPPQLAHYDNLEDFEQTEVLTELFDKIK